MIFRQYDQHIIHIKKLIKITCVLYYIYIYIVLYLIDTLNLISNEGLPYQNGYMAKANGGPNTRKQLLSCTSKTITVVGGSILLDFSKDRKKKKNMESNLNS